MAGITAIIDPTAEGTGTQLDISDGAANNGVGYRLLDPLVLPEWAPKMSWTSSIDTDGSIPSGTDKYDNGELSVGLRITGSSAANLETKLSALRQKLAKLNREQGTLKLTFPSGNSYVFDVREAKAKHDLTNAVVSRNRVDDQLVFTVAPGARGAEISLGTFSETTLPWLAAKVSGSGSGPAYSTEVLADTPALYWRLGETAGTNANDETANNRDGTYTGSFALNQSGLLAGDANPSVDLTGGWIESSYNPFASAALTFEGWAVRDTSAGGDILIGTSSSPFGGRIRLQSGSNDVLIEPLFGNPGGTWTNAWPGNGIVTHWVVTHDQAANTAELWINGVSKGVKTGVTDWNGSVTVHAGASGGGDPFDGRLDEIAVYTSTLSSARIAAHYQAGAGAAGNTAVKGDLPAHTRAVITATEGNQWAVIIGGESRNYSSAATAELGYQAEALTPLGGAATAVGAAGASGSGSNVVRQGTLTNGWLSMLSTQATGGGAHMTHTGSFRVLARVYRPSTNTGAVSVRFEWGQGDFSRWAANPAVSVAADEDEGQWLLVDLGLVHIVPPRQGTHEWEGRIAAKSTVLGDDLDVDWIAFVPTELTYATISPNLIFDTPTAYVARDEFLQSAGPLAGKALAAGAAVSGPRSAGAGADDAGIGSATWSSPGSVVASDDTRATVTVPEASSSHYLKATNFGFALPAGATISGIVVEVERHGEVAIRDVAVRIVKSGTIQSSDRSDTATVWPGSDGIKAYGSPTDLWGTTWTQADINASTFGAAIAVENIEGVD